MILSVQDQSFALKPNDNLLDVLQQNGVDVPYQCKDGYCGTCRVKLTKGQVEYTTEPLAYLPEGEILVCCSKAKTDIEITV